MHEQEKSYTFEQNFTSIGIKLLKFILRFFAWGIVAVSILTPFLASLPSVQRWCGERVCGLLQSRGIHAEVDRLHVNWGGQLVLDDVTVYDDFGDEALTASRLAAKVDLLPLFHKKYHFGSIQINNAHVALSQDSARAPLNIQGIVRALSSKDTTSTTPLDVQIRSLALRHSSFRYDRRDLPNTSERFNPNHILLKDLSLTASLSELTKTSLQLDLRRLSFADQSGFTLSDMVATVQANADSLSISGLSIKFPHSHIAVPQLKCAYASLPDFKKMKPWLEQLHGETRLQLHIVPADFSAFIPKVLTFRDAVNLQAKCALTAGTFAVDSLQLYDNERVFAVLANAKASLFQNDLDASIILKELSTTSTFPAFLQRNLGLNLPKHLANVGRTESSAEIEWKSTNHRLSLYTSTEVGEVELSASSKDTKHWNATIKSLGIRPDKLLGKAKIPTDIDLNGVIEVTMNEKRKVDCSDVRLTIEKLYYNKRSFNNIAICCSTDTEIINASIKSPNEGADFCTEAHIFKKGNTTDVKLDGVLNDFSPCLLGLTKAMEGESVYGTLHADLSFRDIDHVDGYVRLNDVCLNHDSLGVYEVGDLIVNSAYSDGEKNLKVDNQHFDAHLTGRFTWRDLGSSATSILHAYLPSFIHAPKRKVINSDISLNAHVKDTTLIQRTLGIDLRLPTTCTLRGHMDTETGLIDVSANVPQMYYGKEHYSDLSFRAQTTQDILHGFLRAQRHMAKATLDVDAELYASDNKSSIRIAWQGDKPNVPKGSVTAHGLTYKDDAGMQAYRADIEPSTILVGDTLWYIQPGSVDFRKGRLTVKNVGAYSEGRYVKVNGYASRDVKDTLVAQLKDIDVAYVLGLVNFHSVEFDGQASGSVWVSNVFSSPKGNGDLSVRDFAFNGANLGTLTALAEYGQHSKAITLNATIADPANDHLTRIDGAIGLDRKTWYGLDLNILAHRFDLAFLRPYTQSFMSRTEGRASGKARLFGPFKGIDIEGDLELEDVAMKVDALNTTYTLPKDSVHMRQGRIYLSHARVFDERNTNTHSHYADVEAELLHQHFSRMTYSLNFVCHNFLGYNYPTLGSESFCGTALLEGSVHLWGGMKALHADISATPLLGSTLLYNATQPDKITEANFIRFKSPQTDTLATATERAPEKSSTNIFLNFDLNVTPDCALRVLMDSRSGDHIDLRGKGHLRATYFNKGTFQLFGTYQVSEGRYDLSIQDFLHKDFSIQPGSTIVFGGNPNLATLDMRAAYTVPNVSMDDLSNTSLGLPNTRVDCIMHISGQPRQPSVTFDFELPTANEEERQMVRSLLSTEEERNLQVIYLLGIGRFMNLDGAATSTGQNSQSQKAVNGIVSSTISSQFNRVLTSLIGNSNWNIGTNLRTGQMGWDNVDVEGVLSGKLFHNRLLINGNFGYRERFYNTSNFIGDFDVKYLITPTGSIALKAYNKSNDRYFIQSSLNTQGVGVQFKKDFTNLFEIFGRKRSKKSETPTEYAPDQTH